MKQSMIVLALAGTFFALGFLFADRMGTAETVPGEAASSQGTPAFSGTNGAMLVQDGSRRTVVIVRDDKVYFVSVPRKSGAVRPAATLSN